MRQKMSTQTRRELLTNLCQEYFYSSRKKKEQLLDGLITTTGYNRKYAISMLNKPAKVSSRKRNRARIYNVEVADDQRQLEMSSATIRIAPLRGSLFAVSDN